MALQEEVARIKQAKADIKASIEAKGGSVGDGLIDTYANAIDNLPSGGSGGVDIYDYFHKEYSQYESGLYVYMVRMIKKIPPLNLTGKTSLLNLCKNYYNLEEVEQIDTSKTVLISSAFSGCESLIKVAELDGSKLRTLTNVFLSCFSLTHFGGFKNLGMNYETTQTANYESYKLDLSSCVVLTHESLMNVINKLYDIASLGVQTQQLVLGSTNKAKLTADEIAIATNKGWTVS